MEGRNTFNWREFNTQAAIGSAGTLRCKTLLNKN
jgi:hypothetical protein